MQTIRHYTQWFKFAPVDPLIQRKINIINQRRLLYLALVMTLAHTGQIVFFLFNNDFHTPTEVAWHIGIIRVHSVMLCMIMVIGIISFNLQRYKKADGWAAGALSDLTSLSYITFGVVTTLIDQLVMVSIIAFLLACIGIAITMINRPIVSTMLYTAAFVIINLCFSYTQTNQAVKLSLSVNTFFVISIALATSIILWRANVLNLQQKHYIAMQNQELEYKNQQLEYNSKRDFLTGLYNRREFIAFAEREIIRNQRNFKDACGILIDMDNFKLVNDTYGHPAGDLLLQEVALVIMEQLRGMDIAARFGGEEFAILLPETSESGGVKAAERIREAIENIRITINNQIITTTASFGVAMLGDSFKSFYSTADQALYLAKANGRNRVETSFTHPDYQKVLF